MRQNPRNKIVETIRSACRDIGPSTLSPGTIVGGYALVRTIGTGGLGVVYEARHQRLDKPVAVKALQSDLQSDPNARERFLREGRTAAKLRHPNIVDISDVTLDGDTPYLVMELLEGEDLASLLAREGSLSVESTLELLMPVVSALTLAHHSGIAHRDLKPQNIFLNHSAFGTITPKVVDFGASKVVDEPIADLTRSNMCVGTPHYMSPEQARTDKHIDTRCDQFSLGVMAYQCLTGQRPFTGDSLFVVLNAVINHEPPVVHTLRPEVGPLLSAIITKLMAKEAAGRFDDMQAVGQVLLPFASSRVRLAYDREFSSGTATLSPGQQVCPSGLASHTLRSATPLRALAHLRHSSKFTIAALVAALALAWAVSPRPLLLDAIRSARAHAGNTARAVTPLAVSDLSGGAREASTTGATSDSHSQPSAIGVQVGTDRRNMRLASGDGPPSARSRSPSGKPVLDVQAQSPQGDGRKTQDAHVSSVPIMPAAAEHGPQGTPFEDSDRPERGVNGALILP